ncbi:MAG TPA: cyanophycin synthetase [Chloroflexota bacterium]|nr:cyanophycin synthetase [Chloroflexota bacterium]
MSQQPNGLAYLRTFPDFERGNVAAVEAFGLHRILALLDEVGAPQLHVPVLHLAGTKGKGSTAAMLASILHAAGYRTGLFTQPHLLRVHERFMLNGISIDDEEITEIMLEQIRPAVARLEQRGITGVQQFEAQVALALLWFAARRAEVVVLETGLGGRLDGTNVVPHPLATVITPIGHDHMQVLGDTLAQIAGEKAAIIKVETPVIVSPQPAEAAVVIERAAARARAPLLLGGRDWSVEGVTVDLSGTVFTLVIEAAALREAGVALPQRWSQERSPARIVLADLTTALLGAHQATNAAAAALTAIVASEGLPRLNPDAIRAGLVGVQWPGRLQVLPGRPSVVLDGAHTAESAAALAEAIRALFGDRRVILICGIQADKDIPAVVAPLASLAAAALATQAPHPRAASAGAIAAALRVAGCPQVEEAPEPRQALERARALANADDVILVTGSLHLVGAILAGEAPTEH